MTKILATVGPVSEGKNLIKFLEKTDMVRLNMSHNTLSWHKKNIDKIKKKNKKKIILVDIPGVKPRTLNKSIIKIKKGQLLRFSYLNKGKEIIPLSNPLPKITNKPSFFSLSDGAFEFKFISLKKNILSGKSLQSFDLFSKKGLNIPNAIYNNSLQEKLYLKYLKKIKKLKIDCIGLSFIQDSKILKKLKKKYPMFLFVSKLENSLGYINRKDIIQNSDAIMIDRGDLSAEVGIANLSNFSEKIINDCKTFGKPSIIATENLNSLIKEKTPTKSDVINIDYYLSKKIDYIMLSDETATSNNWYNALDWINRYLGKKFKSNIIKDQLSIENLINDFNNQIIIVFSKKGYFYEKVFNKNFHKLFLFTENKNMIKKLSLRTDVHASLVKYPKKSLDNFFYQNIKNNLKNIFIKNKYAYLISLIFPRKNSRANSVSIIEKKDFI
ncbi:MAG: hypothetical protein CMM90_00865 [Rickettsiales bacterium]|nr:hypothetical protein [Rickettsiales bacterium]